MEIKCISSGSKGNAYLISDGISTLLVECGVKFEEVKKATNFRISSIAGCLITHEHGDHAKCYKQLMLRGIGMYATRGTLNELGILDEYNAHPMSTDMLNETAIKTFRVSAFAAHHDAKEPCGFIIKSDAAKETLLFLTDSYYCDYSFNNLDYIMIECNHVFEKLELQLKNPNRNEFTDAHIRRLMKSHMSLETCIEFLKSCSLLKAKEIMLLHLSDTNADEQLMKEEIQKATGKIVRVF